MDAFCTYCSKDKTRDSALLPAIERYTSQRIRSVYSSALSVGLRFFILSGKYGLISASHQINYYDQLLKGDEVDRLSKKVIKQLKMEGLKRVFYFTKDFKHDNKLVPYLNTMRHACNAGSVKLVTVILSDEV